MMTSPKAADSGQTEREALTDQQIYDKFSFLEGVVSEHHYRQIADTAIEIARAASNATAPSDALTNAGNAVTLTGAQLLEALDFIAPDRDSDQLETEATIQYGTGHSGDGIYCWITEYPEEGAILLDGATALAEQSAAPQPTWQHVQWEAHLLEVVEHTIDTIGRQLDLIAERAPGKFLDKTPVVRSLTSHKQRLERAVAERNASFPALPRASEQADEAVDAARYRKLRKPGAPIDGTVFAMVYVHAPQTIPSQKPVVGEELDMVVDAARAKEPK